MLGSTRLQPLATLASGFRFRFEAIEPALDDLLAPLRGVVHERVWEQWLPRAADDLWPFFCDANNLEDITPPLLAFRVLGMSTPAIGAGTLIDYRLRLNGVPFAWQTRIDTWDPPRRLVDRQVKGPYTQWQHTHDFIPMAGGTLMRDIVRYRLPVGWLGTLAGGPKVARDVERIFEYRWRKIDERFGERGSAAEVKRRCSPPSARCFR